MPRGTTKFTAGMMLAWPGLVSIAVVGFWFALWGVLVPSPGSVGSSLRQVALVNPRGIAFVPSVAKLRQVFQRMDYDLETVRNGDRLVPPLYIASVPDGMGQIRQSAERKKLFLQLMLPLVLKANETVRWERQKLLRIKRSINKRASLSDDDRAYLLEMARHYEVRKPLVDLLLPRVDVLPVSIALAQSAIESGWGTSRFVREGNAPFGQWTTASFDGIVPLQRDNGKTHKIRAFENLYASVKSYIHNLNTHRAYRGFRAMRKAMRESGGQLDSLALTVSLRAYSKKGETYIRLLQNIMTGNDLLPLDRARLGGNFARRNGPDI